MTLAESIRDELVKVFTEPQAEVLSHCVVRAHDTLATRSDMHELRVALTELTDAQKKTDATVAELAQALKETSATVAELAQAQKETSATVAELAQAQKETSATVAELAQAQKETSANVADLTNTVRTLSIRTDQTAGWALEWLVGKHLPAYLGRQIRRCKVIGIMDVIEPFEERLWRRAAFSEAGIPTTEEAAAGELSAEEIEDLRRVDLIATGRVATGKIVAGEVETAQLYLVGEVSYRADSDDVLRASRRAALLRKAGFEAQSFVACEAVHDHVAALARRDDVWIIVRGRLLSPAA
jgi:hypothetical protein